jgi:hypothetical protein
VLDYGEAVFALLRFSPDGSERILCLHNISDQPQRINIESKEIFGLFAGTPIDLITDRRMDDLLNDIVALQPYQTLWLKNQRMNMNVNSEYLNLLKDRINLRQIPFSERGSRLLIFQSDGYLTFRLAERWFKREGQLAAYRQRPPLIDQWVFTDEEGKPLEVQLTTYPHRIDCETRLGTFSLAFVDIETVLITLPSVRCSIKFNANLDKIQTDRRGGVLRLQAIFVATWPHQRNCLACSTSWH